jgi:hypothetical protein
MKPLILVMLSLAVPASLAFSAPAEAKRFRFSGGTKPAAKPATPPVAQPAARGGSTLIILPGIGAAHAATRPEETEGKKQPDARHQQELAEAERKEAAKKAEEARRASLPPGREIPRLGTLSSAEAQPALPGFATLN